MNVVNHLKVAVLRFAIPAVVCIFIACLFSPSSHAQQQQNFQQPSAVNPIQWTPGPATKNFGDIAEIKVPDGYQFLDENGGRYFLQAMHNPAPKNLVGIMAPTTAKWYAIIGYSGIGYVKDTDAAQLNPGAMLDKIHSLIARQNIPIAADWAIKPSYDAAQNKMEWAIRGVTRGGGAATVNYSVRLFGRRGIMEVIVVQPESDFDAAPLREVINGISFQKGERYADYQAGDKLSKSTLAQLSISGNDDSNAASSGGWWKRMILWAGAGLLALVVVAVIALKLFLRGSRSMAPAKRTAAPAARPLPAAPQASATVTAAQPVAPAPANPKEAVASGRMGDRNGRTLKPGGRKRRKQYNFHLFYSDMIMNLTRWNYIGGFGTYASDYSHGFNNLSPEQERLAEENKMNGAVESGNGANGNPAGNGSHNHNGSGSAGAAPDAARLLAVETAKLIENQQKLIEGQRKLIEDQNKLIQEKSKLIDFETSVLGKQSELIGEQELL